jgi:hypothetical protein
MDRPRLAAIATATGCAAAAAAINLGIRIHREAKSDSELVADALREASEAVSRETAGRRRRQEQQEPRSPRAPQLGLLGVHKVVGAVWTGGRLLIIGSLINEALHRGPLRLQRGAVRTHVGAALATIAKSFQIAGTTAIVVSAALSFSLTRRVAARVLKRRRQSSSTLEGLFAGAFEELGEDLHEWGNNQPLDDFKTHSEGHVGWLLREPEAPLLVDQTAQFHAKLRELGMRKDGTVTRKLLIDIFGLPPLQGGWDGVSVLLIPGLWTKWYPLYWVHLRQALDHCAIDYHFSKCDSDATSAENSLVVKKEIESLLASSSRSVLIYAHSKGALDAASVVHDLPDKQKARLCGFVACQGPFGGAITAHDAIRTRVLSSILDTLFGRLLRGAGMGAVADLTYDARKDYYKKHGTRWWVHPALRGDNSSDKVWVPTVCLCAAATHEPRALLSPIVEYYRYRYGRDRGGAVDGLCARTDTALPGATCVFLSDMDHFGPAWTGFPAMDRYDSVDVFFVLSALAFHRAATAQRQARKLRLRPARRQRARDADDLALEADVSEGFATEIEDEEPGGLARIASWGFFA